MAAAILQGLLGGLGETGQQLGEARQLNEEEQQRRQAAQMAIEQHAQAAQAARERSAMQALQMKQLQQPQMIDKPFTAGGKQVAYYRDASGAISQRELPGAAPDTPEQQLYNSLMKLPGMTSDRATKAVETKFGGPRARIPHFVTQVDPDSTVTGYSQIASDPDTGEFLYKIPNVPRGGVGYETESDYTDPVSGLVIHRQGKRTPLGPGGVPIGGGGVPTGTLTAPSGFQGDAGGTGDTLTPQQEAQAQQLLRPSKVLPPDATGPGVAQLNAQGPLGIPQGALGRAGDQTGQGDPAALQGGAVQAPGTTLNVGTYRGLTKEGQIPDNTPGWTPVVIEAANSILQGADANSIPNVGLRYQARRLATQYGWKGQGSLTPKEQLNILEADKSIQRLMGIDAKGVVHPNILKVLDNPVQARLIMAMSTPDPETYKGMELRRDLKKWMSPEALQFSADLKQLTSLMGGFRKFTGGSTAEAQTKRYTSELPDPTDGSVNAARKLRLLQNELNVAKQYGYFPRELPGTVQGAATGTSAPEPAPVPQVGDRINF
jgi:hypothetical protein